jgi:hypothetical protein
MEAEVAAEKVAMVTMINENGLKMMKTAENSMESGR